MANKKQWANVNGADAQYHADMESPAPTGTDTGYHLHVTDIQNAADTALKASNTDGVDAKALDVTGQAVVRANNVAGSDSTGMIISNSSYRTGSKVLTVYHF